MEENRIPKKVFYMNLETTRLRGRPRNKWQDEVREDGRLVIIISINHKSVDTRWQWSFYILHMHGL
jgi:hypothetical protein